MAKNKNYKMNIVIGGKVNASLSQAVSTASGLLGKLTGNSALGNISAKTGAITKLGIGLSAAGIAVAGVVKGTQKLVSFSKECVDEAKAYESAMADVAKVVDGLTDEEGRHTQAYVEMSKEILNLSTKIPMSATEIAQIVEQAGQANIEPDQLVRFAESAAKMGIAFDTTAEQSGQWMAVWRTSMNLTQDEVETLADQINYLGNTSSENALKISEVVTDVGSLGKIAGLTSAEVAALAAATTGVEASVAGTGIKNMIVALSSGTAATKKQKAAFDKLGISATKLSVRMQKDAQGAILDVLKAINKLPGSQQTAVIKDIFGKTSLETVAKLAGNVDNLQEQLDKINDPSLYTGSMDKEFETRSKTFENQLQLWENTKDRFKIEIGTQLLEFLNKTLPDLLPKLQQGLDDILPEIEKALNNFDVSKFIDDIAGILPSIKDFVVNVIPLLPDALNTLELAFRLLSTAVQGLFDWLSKISQLISDIKNSTGEQWFTTLFNKAATITVPGSGVTPPTQEPTAGSHGVANPKVSMDPSEFQTVLNPPDSRAKNNRNGGTKKVPVAANGAIVTDPTLIYAGEGGESEAVLPLSKLDAMLSGNTTNNSKTMTVTYAPVINFQGNDTEELRSVMDDEFEKFKRYMEQYERENDRTRL